MSTGTRIFWGNDLHMNLINEAKALNSRSGWKAADLDLRRVLMVTCRLY